MSTIPIVMAGEAGAPAYLTLSAALVVAAAVFGYLSVRVHVVPIVGFLLAGVLIGPAQLGLVAEVEAVDAAAEIGIILLLFTIGIEFSLQRLARVWRWIVIGGGLQVLLATAAGMALVLLIGGDVRVGIFTGFLIALSSTAIVLKITADAGESTTVRGRLALAVLIFQDLAVVAMVLLVPSLGPERDGGIGALAQALGVAVLVIAGVLIVARRVMPPALERIAALCSTEVFLLAVIAICLGTAYLTALAGVSVSLGAFLAGLLVSESRQSAQAFAEVLPLQIIFSAIFFLSVGMLLDVGFLLDNIALVLGAAVVVLVVKTVTTTLALLALRVGWRPALAGGLLLDVGFLLDNIALVLGAAVVVLVVKTVTTTLALLALRVGWRPALAGGLLLGQVGEFSFVLVTAGAAVGLSPAGLGDRGAQTFVATTVVLMMATPLLALAGRRLTAAGDRATATDRAADPEAGAERDDHVVILGWGPASVRLGRDLRARGLDVALTTLNPQGAHEAERAGLDVLRGDALHQQILQEAGVPRARAVVVAEHEATAAASAVTSARALTSAPIFVRPLDGLDVEALAGAGASHVIDPDATTHRTLLSSILERLELPASGTRQTGGVDTTRLYDVTWPSDAGCAHAASSVPVLPHTSGCAECERDGETWVHLRICLSCGHVGCCDSSPHRHARAHSGDNDHPLVISGEDGESWAYCFVDDLTVETQGTS